MTPFRPFTRLACLMRDRHGNVGLIFAVSLVLVVVAAGTAIDFTRAAQFKTVLQGDVDAAATAGASAYVDANSAASGSTVATNYMNSEIPLLPPNIGVTYVVTPGTVSTGGVTSGYTVAVTASGQISTTLLGIFRRTVPVSVSSTAENPLVNVSIDLGNSTFCACDSNTIYIYAVPKDGSLPAMSAMTQIFTNNGANATGGCVTATNNPTVPPMTASQKIGFAFNNVTGGNCAYGPNMYGGLPGSTHMYYTQLNPPSADAYPTVNQDCALEIAVVPSGTSSTTPPAAGTCLPATPANATPICQSVGNQTLRFYWNDMGGGRDDYDYNDGIYNFSCSSPVSGPTSVFVMQ